MNNCTFLGRVTKDFMPITTGNGTKIVGFSIAINEKYKDQETVEFVNLKSFGKQAEILAKHLRKGDMICVNAKYHESKYQDKDGNTRSKVEFIIKEFSFVGSSQGKNSGGEIAPSPSVNNGFDSDDLPF